MVKRIEIFLFPPFSGKKTHTPQQTRSVDDVGTTAGFSANLTR